MRGEKAVRENSVRSAISTHERAGGLVLFCLALAPECSLGAAVSGGSDTELQEIVVTAQKREERLLDVPVPVTAVTAEALLEQNQTKAEDFFSSVPGVNLQSMYGRSQLAIRGITTSPVSGNPVVGFTIDDVPFGSSTGNGGLFGAAPDIDPSELNHIEVLRGPQGTLYGAASMGGLVKYVLVDPSTDRLSGVAGAGTETIEDSNSLGHNARAAINVPLSETFAMRASAYERTDPGYIDNVRTGEKDVNTAQVMGGRLAFLWKPSDALLFKLNALYQDRDLFGPGNVDVTLGRSQTNNWPNTGRIATQNQLYSLVVNADLGHDMQLTSESAYGHNSNYDITDFSAAGIKQLWAIAFDPNSFSQEDADNIYGPGAITVDPTKALNPNWGTILRQDYSVNKISQEIRLAMPIGSRIDWLIGGFYTHESAKYAIQTSAFDQNTGRFYTQADYWASGDPQPNGQASSYDFPVVWHDNVRFSEGAAFTNVTTRFTEQFDVQLGARYSKNRQEMNHREYTPFNPFGFFLNPTYDGHSLTYQVSPRFKITPEHMIYARVATGYRAGGPNPTGCGAKPCSYGPDKTTNYEVGAKGSLFDKAATYEVSVYDIEWKDIQITAVDSSGTFTYLSNGGTARSRGIEAAFAFAPTEGLTLSLWGTYLDATVREAFPNSTVFVEPGARLPFSSRLSGRFSATQEFRLPKNMTARVGGSVVYVGERLGEFVDTVQDNPLRQTYPAYATVDLNSGVTFGDWKLNLFVQNVLDRRGLNGGGYYNQTNWNGNWFSTTQPRTIGVNADWSF
jgi:iron complex outermembrane receptor protein